MIRDLVCEHCWNYKKQTVHWCLRHYHQTIWIFLNSCPTETNGLSTSNSCLRGCGVGLEKEWIHQKYWLDMEVGAISAFQCNDLQAQNKMNESWFFFQKKKKRRRKLAWMFWWWNYSITNKIVNKRCSCSSRICKKRNTYWCRSIYKHLETIF